jgi:hypothetical protein
MYVLTTKDAIWHSMTGCRKIGKVGFSSLRLGSGSRVTKEDCPQLIFCGKQWVLFMHASSRV